MAFEIHLSEKVAIVTGATTGIGLGISIMLARAGCCIAGCSLAENNSQEVLNFKSKIESEGVDCFYDKLDVTHFESIPKFINKVKKRYGRIDILVSNAGANLFQNPDQCKNENWQYNMDLNLTSHWQMAKYCKPHLSKSDNGVIIIVTSNHAFTTLKNCFPYNVAKTALTGLVRSLTIDWGSELRTVGIAPGFIENKNSENWFKSFENPKEKRADILDIHPVKRFGTPEDIGAFCVFLASEYAKFIAGVTYLVDGGRSAVMQDV